MDNALLAYIESIVGDDETEHWQMHDALEELTEREQRMLERIVAVYHAAHAFNSNHECYHVHGGWRAEAIRGVPFYVKAGNEVTR